MELWQHHQAEKGIITLSNSTVKLEYFKSGKSEASAKLPEKCSLSEFESNTSSKTREEVFAKFINQTLDNNANYNIAKKACAVAASNNLAKRVKCELKLQCWFTSILTHTYLRILLRKNNGFWNWNI